MKITAFVFWALSLIALAMQFFFTVGSISSGEVGGPTTTIAVGFFDGMTAFGALSYGAVFAFFVAGCVFWVGHLAANRRL